MRSVRQDLDRIMSDRNPAHKDKRSAIADIIHRAAKQIRQNHKKEHRQK